MVARVALINLHLIRMIQFNQDGTQNDDDLIIIGIQKVTNLGLRHMSSPSMLGRRPTGAKLLAPVELAIFQNLELTIFKKKQKTKKSQKNLKKSQKNKNRNFLKVYLKLIVQFFYGIKKQNKKKLSKDVVNQFVGNGEEVANERLEIFFKIQSNFLLELKDTLYVPSMRLSVISM